MLRLISPTICCVFLPDDDASPAQHADPPSPSVSSLSASASYVRFKTCPVYRGETTYPDAARMLRHFNLKLVLRIEHYQEADDVYFIVTPVSVNQMGGWHSGLTDVKKAVTGAGDCTAKAVRNEAALYSM